MDAAQPIIVKKIKKGGHGHHGGAWKVAFADFVTAMMAFFLLLWLTGSTTPEQKAAISDYFQNPSAVMGPGGASTSMIKLGAVDAEKAAGETKDNKNQEGDGKSEVERVKIKEVEVDRDVKKETERLNSLKQDLEKAIQASEALNQFKDQLLLDITPEGLRIQIIDKKNRPMFASGRSDLKDYTKVILHEIAKVISRVPNKISLTGHTDATPFRSMRGYTNWELSADRANASRRELVNGGLPESKIAKVVGLSSTVLFDAKSPQSPINRRISLIVMNKQAEDKIISEAGALAGLANKANTPKSFGRPSKPITMLPSKGKPLLIPGKPTIQQIGAPLQLGKPKTKPNPSNKNNEKTIKLQTF